MLTHAQSSYGAIYSFVHHIREREGMGKNGAARAPAPAAVAAAASELTLTATANRRLPEHKLEHSSSATQLGEGQVLCHSGPRTSSEKNQSR